MKNKTLFNSLIFTFSLIGSCLVLDKPIKANDSPICPDPSAVNISGIGIFNNDPDPESFISRTNALGGNGFCKTTPEKYGVKVFKMGFCKQNPGNPSGTGALEGQNPNYSSCSWSLESTDGINAEFSATTSIDLPQGSSSKPAAGTYSHAVMIMSKDLRIKGNYGPVGGTTYYSKNANSLTDYAGTTDINEYDFTTAPLISFTGPDRCGASSEGVPVTGGTLSAYLLDNTGKMEESEPGPLNPEIGCADADKLLGVVNMTNDLTIDDNTNGLKMTFGVTNAMAVVLDNLRMEFQSQAFNVTFETF